MLSVVSVCLSDHREGEGFHVMIAHDLLELTDRGNHCIWDLTVKPTSTVSDIPDPADIWRLQP